uniref:Uncharacterized protein n=1 Tax=Panagrolaimus sp. ES5 TaxID=591445 RepID=A0AC34GMI8_9BILA
METKFFNELKDQSIEPVPNTLSKMAGIYEEKYSNFQFFVATVQAWLEKEEIYRFTSSALIEKFVRNLVASNNVDRPVTVIIKTFDVAFVDFLTMISSFKFKNVAKDFRQVYEVIILLLVTVALEYSYFRQLKQH